MTISLSINGSLLLKNQFDWRKQERLVLKFAPCNFKGRHGIIQEELPFLLLAQEDKKKFCFTLQGALSAWLRRHTFHVPNLIE